MADPRQEAEEMNRREQKTMARENREYHRQRHETFKQRELDSLTEIKDSLRSIGNRITYKETNEGCLFAITKAVLYGAVLYTAIKFGANRIESKLDSINQSLQNLPRYEQSYQQNNQ